MVAVESESFFVDNFRQLTAHNPYLWQKKLFLSFTAASAGPWPEVLDLPTGTGKTSVLYVWLLALAWSIRTKTFGVPRRLAWIVNRRVVVDQITKELEDLLSSITEQSELHEQLISISFTGNSLLASTLRGQFADNGDWSRDPSTPAVVVGTVDMIGSRLLFRGYRAGPYHRPMHAGMLGVDTLIVNDEAHLSPALAMLLKAVRDRGPAKHIAAKSFRILLLSATLDPSDGLQRLEHDPEEDAAENPHFSRVFHAPKSLSLREVANLNELDGAIWALATEAPVTRTAIFIEQPEKASKLAERLRKDKRPCALLTGTMRGFERDKLSEDETFKRFLSPATGAEPVWLVCTSAGEVGLNFSCERMITGLAEADHLLQRFGRLNRFGSATPGEAFLVFRAPSEKEPRLRATLAYLLGLDGDVSCSEIWKNRAPADACTEPPLLARFEERLVDMWAQTTYKDRSVPPVASWLHGKQEIEVPDTELAWRADVDFLTEWGVGEEQIRKVLEYYPVQTHERLSEPSSRVAGKLKDIAERIGAAKASRTKLIVANSDGTPSVCDLASLVDLTKKDRSFLDYKMLLLPNGLGSVPAGMFHPSEPTDTNETLDVADTAPYTARVRFVCRGGDLERLRTQNGGGGEASKPLSVGRSDLEDFASDRYRPALIVGHPEDEETFLVYFGARSTKKHSKPVNVDLSDHQKSVAATAKALLGRLGLADLAELYERAGNIHDSGKAREVWQRAMGGSMNNPLAKTRLPVNLRLIDGYRHELGSLLDAVSQVHEETDDLLLHLVASHHAAGRPYFETRQYDRANLRRSAGESMEIARRYARLQRRYGAWGLAYLEALFKCADAIVSGSEGEPASA